jgi:hypothetical protein
VFLHTIEREYTQFEERVKCAEGHVRERGEDDQLSQSVVGLNAYRRKKGRERKGRERKQRNIRKTNPYEYFISLSLSLPPSLPPSLPLSLSHGQSQSKSKTYEPRRREKGETSGRKEKWTVQKVPSVHMRSADNTVDSNARNRSNSG